MKRLITFIALLMLPVATMSQSRLAGSASPDLGDFLSGKIDSVYQKINLISAGLNGNFEICAKVTDTVACDGKFPKLSIEYAHLNANKDTTYFLDSSKVWLSVWDSLGTVDTEYKWRFEPAFSAGYWIVLRTSDADTSAVSASRSFRLRWDLTGR
uniref:Uncharacterized protein n=1 Tax=viral metagenome TaxID=1070528 RepID=A0A6M3KX52_9ZZZZ